MERVQYKGRNLNNFGGKWAWSLTSGNFETLEDAKKAIDEIDAANAKYDARVANQDED